MLASHNLLSWARSYEQPPRPHQAIADEQTLTTSGMGMILVEYVFMTDGFRKPLLWSRRKGWSSGNNSL
jgi:hypothetical protein